MFFGLLAADGASVAIVLQMALLAGHQMTALVYIADTVGFTELAVECALVSGCEGYFLLEVVELPFADALPARLVPLPNVFKRAVDE
jgi:hypothetical protein